MTAARADEPLHSITWRKIMNHIYRSIWNDKTGTFVAVSENASSGSKSSSGAGALGNARASR